MIGRGEGGVIIGVYVAVAVGGECIGCRHGWRVCSGLIVVWVCALGFSVTVGGLTTAPISRGVVAERGGRESVFVSRGESGAF